MTLSHELILREVFGTAAFLALILYFSYNYVALARATISKDLFYYSHNVLQLRKRNTSKLGQSCEETLRQVSTFTIHVSLER